MSDFETASNRTPLRIPQQNLTSLSSTFSSIQNSSNSNNNSNNEESTLPHALQRSLGDRSYDKRKNAALEIEALIKLFQGKIFCQTFVFYIFILPIYYSLTEL